MSVVEQSRAPAGEVARVVGPLVGARNLSPARLYDVVRVGALELVGEIIRLEGGLALIQVYEETSGLRVGDPVVSTGAPLELELGPGLLGEVFDGIQRPLRPRDAGGEGARADPFLQRGPGLPALDRARRWRFEPTVAQGDEVAAGDILGETQERALRHRILCPHGVAGRVTRVVDGEVGVDEPVVWVDDGAREVPVAMLRLWPVRDRRPCVERLDPNVPLITGQRVVDVLFPIARGGSGAIPGGFGTGKTVLEQSLARWADVDVVIYVACGERGNEVTELIEAFGLGSGATDHADLGERIIFVVNTSNMPIAAREASIFTGITMAEYYRDQGYDVALLADSTTRWGEALREVSSHLAEMPGEEGHPTYLASRLAEFYERAGRVTCLGAPARQGSVSVVGAVSPPAGDFSEPITQSSLRLVGTFWALDTDLARARHFPAIDWNRSYSLYDLRDWFAAEVDEDWEKQRGWMATLLQQEAELLAIVQLLGADALAAPQRVILLTGRILREDFLQQSAFDPVDANCPLHKQHQMLRVVHALHDELARAVEAGTDFDALAALPVIQSLAHMRRWPLATARASAQQLVDALRDAMRSAGATPR